MGRSRGSEPPTSGTTNQRSNQLSYDRHRAVRPKRDAAHMRRLDSRQAGKCVRTMEKETGRRPIGPRPSSLCSVHGRNEAFSPSATLLS